MIKRLLSILSILLIFGLTGCYGGDAQLGEITLTSGLDETNHPVDSLDEFTLGTTVYLAVEFIGGYEGLEAKVSWYQADALLESQTITLPREVDSLDPLWLSAELQTDENWESGEYRCELFAPDQGTTVLTFQLKQ